MAPKAAAAKHKGGGQQASGADRGGETGGPAEQRQGQLTIISAAPARAKRSAISQSPQQHGQGQANGLNHQAQQPPSRDPPPMAPPPKKRATAQAKQAQQWLQQQQAAHQGQGAPQPPAASAGQAAAAPALPAAAPPAQGQPAAAAAPAAAQAAAGSRAAPGGTFAPFTVNAERAALMVTMAEVAASSRAGSAEPARR